MPRTEGGNGQAWWLISGNGMGMVYPRVVCSPMKLSEFQIGCEFASDGGRWRCTDVGTRVVVAIRIDQATITRKSPDEAPSLRTISGHEADEIGWFDGPPYNVLERVFGEDDQESCVA